MFVNGADGFVIVLYIILILILAEWITLRAHFCASPSQHFMINCLFNIAAEHKSEANNHTVISVFMAGWSVYHQRYQITFSQEGRVQKDRSSVTSSIWSSDSFTLLPFSAFMTPTCWLYYSDSVSKHPGEHTSHFSLCTVEMMIC